MTKQKRIEHRFEALKTQRNQIIRKLKKNDLNGYKAGRLAGKLDEIDSQIKFLKTLQDNE